MLLSKRQKDRVASLNSSRGSSWSNYIDFLCFANKDAPEVAKMH